MESFVNIKYFVKKCHFKLRRFFQVNFNAGSQSLPRGMDGRRGSRSQLSFSRKFPFVKSTDKLNEFTDNERKFYNFRRN